MRKGKSVVAAAGCVILVVGMLSGCGKAKDKTFAVDNLSITLNEDFTEQELVTQTGYFVSLTSIVTVLKEELTVFESAGLSTNMSLSDYASLVLTTNQLETEVKSDDGLVGFEYAKTESGKNYQYAAFVYKGSDAYWLVQFGCESKNFDKYREDFIKWAKSVEVK